MKKIIVTLLVIAMLCSMLFAFTACTKREDKLVVYNWGDYIDETIIPEFEAFYAEKTGKKITVDYRTFDTNEDMLQKVNTSSEIFDVLCPSDYAIEKLIKSNSLSKITKENITNYKNIEPSTLGLAYDANNEYSIPYMWGTVGILYNREKISKEELDKEGWGILWNSGNNPNLENGVLMKDSVRDAIVAAGLYLHQEELRGMTDVDAKKAKIFEYINVDSDQDIQELEEVLKSIKTCGSLNAWEVDSGKSDIITGEGVYANLAWSGDATWAIEEAESFDVDLGYYIPSEGTNIWVDGWCIPNNAINKEAAEMWIDYMLKPKVALKNMDFIGYTSAVSKTVMQESNLIEDESFFNNIVRYPSDDIIKRAADMRDFGDYYTKVNEMWNRIHY